MESLITSFFIQKKECTLPSIGSFRIKRISASTDDGKILPPAEHIIFNSSSQSPSPELLQYISRKKNIKETAAENRLIEFCNQLKKLLDQGEKIRLGTMGIIYQDGNNINFQRDSNNFFKPIDIGILNNEIILNDTTPEVTVTTNPNMIKELPFEDPEADKSYWGMWALILVGIISVILFFHFIDLPFSLQSTGNQNHFSIDSAGATWFIPK